ncbi:YcxB family protein [Reichenbachiella sp. MSK19-1]|uniref:YcxB family protein n=1 Tax=Reichenbachiella sp. MSK19-1 TaxID=1897631 RepID=UPI0011C3916E|nr:YcxB family protein [Reichenbachiella sp. MSK19-1]
MKIEFELKEGDLLNYNLYINKARSKKNRIATFVILGILGIFILSFIYDQFQQGMSVQFVGLMAFVMLLSFFVTRKIRNPIGTAVKNSIKNNPELIGSRAIELTPIELIYATPTIESKHAISSFIRLEESDEHLYLFNGEMTAVIIPRTAFETVSQYEEFKETIEKSR